MTRSILVDGWRIEVTSRPGVPRVLSAVACARIVAAALRAGVAPNRTSIGVVLANDAELAELNETHLGHEGPTDVLSFPLLEPGAFPPHVGRATSSRSVATSFVLPPRTRVHLGDIAVSVERAVAQASEGRGGQTGDIAWAAADELGLLLTHGTLHVCGWDHATPVEEAAMRALERSLLEPTG